MKKHGLLSKIAALSGALFLLAGLALPLPAFAAGAEYYSRDISVALEDDGSATVTEVWDLSASEGTEVYIEMINLDEQTVSDLAVSENGQQFENIGTWDTGASFSEKAGKCGMVTRGDGYELCWGLGSYGRHTFTVSYRMTNMVKGYADAEVIEQTFIGREWASTIDSVTVSIYRQGETFTVENTGVWAEGSTQGEIYVKNGKVEAYTTAPFQPNTEFTVLVQFAEGMFHPLVQRDMTFEELKQRELEGSGYSQPEDWNDDGYTGDDYVAVYPGGGFRSVFSGLGTLFSMVVPMLIPIGIVVVVVVLVKSGMGGSGSGSGATRQMKPEYRDVPYSRALPWGGSLPATYARLDDLSQLGSEGDIIGAYLLKWVRTRQVELTTAQGGVFGNKQEDAIRLYAARGDMEPKERELYDMLVAAAGSDYVLQSKEFEKWSRRQYERVQGWLESYKNQGKGTMRQMGALTEVETRVFFGLIPSRKTVMTEAGEKLTVEMFGFKKYLQDFTIINEREAREVQLWDDYLVFAQVFGIADEVAKQFKELYPDYFAKMATELGYGRVDMFDIYLLTRMSRNFGQAMYSGYRAGYNAAHSSSSFGGGGGSFGGSGGGGGFGGASGGGGGGVR